MLQVVNQQFIGERVAVETAVAPRIPVLTGGWGHRAVAAGHDVGYVQLEWEVVLLGMTAVRTGPSVGGTSLSDGVGGVGVGGGSDGNGGGGGTLPRGTVGSGDGVGAGVAVEAGSVGVGGAETVSAVASGVGAGTVDVGVGARVAVGSTGGDTAVSDGPWHEISRAASATARIAVKALAGPI